MSCPCNNPKPKKCSTNTPPVLEINNVECPVLFHTVVIPASKGDTTTIPPIYGAYRNARVTYEADGVSYLYDSDGIPQLLSNGGGEGAVKSVNGKTGEVVLTASDLGAATTTALGNETSARTEADNGLQNQIDAISVSSDVTDVVGTYAELQSYDTSKLKDNDIIKVLDDESQSDQTTYYRWNKTTHSFSLIGAEGPYYTKSAADTKFQDKLTAGDNITISEGVISAKGQTVFYANTFESGASRHIYKDSTMSTAVSMQDILDANEDGQVILRMSTSADPTTYNDAYLQNAYSATGDYQLLFLDNINYYEYDSTTTSATVFDYSKSTIQLKLSAGSNISISGNTISATDTTYSNFVGTDGTSVGTAGLVPAPATTDAGKFLKADGTWDDAGGGTLYTTYGQNIDGAMTQKATTDLVFVGGDHTKINIGDNGITAGNNCIVIGSEDSGYSVTGADDQIIIGHNATTSYKDSLLIGHNTEAKGQSSVVVGGTGVAKYGSVRVGHAEVAYKVDTGEKSVSIGYNSRVAGSYSVGIGATVNGSGSENVIIGDGADTSGYNNGVAIGYSSKNSGGNDAVAIGHGANAKASKSIAIGSNSAANAANSISIGSATGNGAQYSIEIGSSSIAYNADSGVALGRNSETNHNYSVALGAYSKTRAQGVVDISCVHSSTNYGYQGTNDSARTGLRVISGVHDGEQTTDAATVAQGNTLATSAPTTSTAGVLGQLYTDTTAMHTYQLTAIDTTDPDNPSYTWQQRW